MPPTRDLVSPVTPPERTQDQQGQSGHDNGNDHGQAGHPVGRRLDGHGVAGGLLGPLTSRGGVPLPTPRLPLLSRFRSWASRSRRCLTGARAVSGSRSAIMSLVRVQESGEALWIVFIFRVAFDEHFLDQVAFDLGGVEADSIALQSRRAGRRFADCRRPGRSRRPIGLKGSPASGRLVAIP